MGLWLLFFFIGLYPHLCFDLLRALGQVTTPRALVNSPYVLTLAQAAFLGWFVFHRCREAGLDAVEARGKGLQAAIVSLAAFLPIELNRALARSDAALVELQRIYYLVAVVKCLAWLYLFSIPLRYYFVNGYEVFVAMRSFFPSVHRQRRRDRQSEPPRREQEEAPFRP